MKDFNAVRNRLAATSGTLRHRFTVRSALDELAAAHDPTEPALLARLAKAWSGRGFEADPAYLREIASSVRNSSDGVLECGTGLTTLLLAVTTSVPVVSLEQHEPSYRKIMRCLDHLGCRHVHVERVSMSSHGVWDWYDWVPHRNQTFDLVLCDGPPGTTRGGRYGLLPAVHEHLTPGALLLLDDAHRSQEAETVGRWVAEFGLKLEGEGGSERKFARMRVPKDVEASPDLNK